MQETAYKEDEIEIDLWELMAFFLHWLWLLIGCGVVAGVAGFLACHFMIAPTYESTTKVYILDRDSNGGTLTYSDMQISSMLIKDYVQLIKDRTVLEEVLRNMGLEESYESLRGRVKVEAQSDTRIIAIVVTDQSPQKAQALADEIRRVAAIHIKDVTQIQAVNVVEEANLPKTPSGPPKRKWTAIFGLAGMAVCMVILILWFLLDDTIKTSEDVEKYLGLSTLSMIPVFEDKNSKNKKKAGEPEGASQDPGEKRRIYYSDSEVIQNPKHNLDETGDLEEVL